MPNVLVVLTAGTYAALAERAEEQRQPVRVTAAALLAAALAEDSFVAIERPINVRVNLTDRVPAKKGKK